VLLHYSYVTPQDLGIGLKPIDQRWATYDGNPGFIRLYKSKRDYSGDGFH
jgi:hypothetical protein